jgi:hypothetical protein
MLCLKVFIKILFTRQCVKKNRIIRTEKKENEKLERNHVHEESVVLRKKRDVLKNENKIILEKWFEENITPLRYQSYTISIIIKYWSS